MSGDFQHRIDLVKERIVPSDFIGRVVILKRHGRDHFGLCPFHHEKTPSFTVYDAKQFFKCFGCGQSGDVIKFAQLYYNLKFIEALERLEREGGIYGVEPSPQLLAEIAKAKREREAKEARKRAAMQRGAQAIIRELKRLTPNDPVDRYLRGRAHLPPANDDGELFYPENAGWPDDVLFHPRLEHPRSELRFAAMVCLIRDFRGDVISIHRTYLQARPDGSVGKAELADPKDNKLTLGSFMGGAIRLGPPSWRQGFAEGVETALSCRQLFGVWTWSTISSGNMPNVRPSDVCGEAIYYADRDKNRVGRRKALQSAALQRQRGLYAVARQPKFLGDYNAVLKELRGFALTDKERVAA